MNVYSPVPDYEIRRNRLAVIMFLVVAISAMVFQELANPSIHPAITVLLYVVTLLACWNNALTTLPRYKKA